MKNYIIYLVTIAISLLLQSCNDDLDCDTNAVIVHDGDEECATALTSKFELVESNGVEAAYMTVASDRSGTLSIVLFAEGALETDQPYKWVNNVQFSAISGESVVDGTATIMKLDRDNRLMSFTFSVDRKRVNNNIYTTSGTVTDLVF